MIPECRTLCLQVSLHASQYHRYSSGTLVAISVVLLLMCLLAVVGFSIFRRKTDAFRFHYFKVRERERERERFHHIYTEKKELGQMISHKRGFIWIFTHGHLFPGVPASVGRNIERFSNNLACSFISPCFCMTAVTPQMLKFAFIQNCH